MESDLGARLIGEKPMEIQEKFRIAILISKAALHFWTAIDGLDLDNQDKKQTEEADNVGSRYYCHQCGEAVVTDPVDVSMACPLCQGGFIEESAIDSDGDGGMVISHSDQIVLEVVENTNGSALNIPFLTNQEHDDSNLSWSSVLGIGSDAVTSSSVPGHVLQISHVSRSVSRRLSPGANVGLNQPTHETRITSSVWFFSVTGFSFEAVSAFFDQVSTPQKPQYALYGMLLSIVAVLVSILDLILNAMKPRRIASESNILWDILPEIFGLTLACLQCISSTLQFSFLCRHATNPVKVSLVPFLFFFVLFAFKYRNERN